MELVNETNRHFLFAQKVYFPTTVFFDKLSSYLSSLDEGKLLLLAAPSVVEQVKTMYAFATVVEHTGEPTEEDVASCTQVVEQEQIQVILAVGGGSVLDLAKRVKQKTEVQLIAAPSTPATGAEVTPYAVITEAGKKKPYVSKDLVPEVAVLDVSFLKTLSQEQWGYSLMDALSHALEALVSKRATPLSDTFALHAIKTIVTQYKVSGESTEEQMQFLLIAGWYAGLAQSMASVGAIHAIAHYLGSEYNIPHSKAITLVMPRIVKHYAAQEVYKKVESTGVVTNETLGERIEEMREHFNLVRNIEMPEKEVVFSLIQRDVCMLTTPVRLDDALIEQVVGECTQKSS